MLHIERRPRCGKRQPVYDCKNEVDVLERCLESADELVDEIIIVDTGSTDRTRKIAARFTDKRLTLA